MGKPDYCRACHGVVMTINERLTDIRKNVRVLEKSPGTSRAKSAQTNIRVAKEKNKRDREMMEGHNCGSDD